MKLIQLSIYLIVFTLFGQCIEVRADSPKYTMTFDEYKHAVDQTNYEKHSIGLSEFKTLCGKPDVYILDLRSPEEYKAGHIKGALHLGANITDERLQRLVPNKKATIITYCSASFAPRSPRVPMSRTIPMTVVALPQILTLKYPNTSVLKDHELWLHPLLTNEDYKETFGELWQANLTAGAANTATEDKSAKQPVPSGPEADAYLADLRRRIKRAWFPPKDGESKNVVVLFMVHRGGELSNLRLGHSSGVAFADQAALKAVENAAPFRQLPSALPDEVRIQFTFDCGVFSGNIRDNAIFIGRDLNLGSHPTCGAVPNTPRRSSSLRPMTFDEYKQTINHIDAKRHSITLSKFKELYDKPGVKILDLRDEQLYKQGHIKGSLNIGSDITDERLKELVPDKKATIIIYCENNMIMKRRFIPMTHVALPQIIALGYPNTFELEGSFANNEFGELWAY